MTGTRAERWLCLLVLDAVWVAVAVLLALPWWSGIIAGVGIGVLWALLP